MMEKIKYLFVGSISLMLISCSGETESAKHNHGNHEQSEVVGEKYYCPMKCEADKTYDEKGECSVCHMDLVK